jgi:hypothetical protein
MLRGSDTPIDEKIDAGDERGLRTQDKRRCGGTETVTRLH